MIRRSAAIAAARTLNAAFFVTTATYCLLTYSPFAFQQFIRPHLIAALTSFVVWHPLLYWMALAITALTLRPYVAASRLLVLTFLVACAVIGVWELVTPILPEGENTGRGLALAMGALVPPIWLAIIDHAVVVGVPPVRPTSERRLAVAALAAALGVSIIYIAIAPLQLQRTVGVSMSARGILFGSAMSVAAHLMTFAALLLVLLAIVRLASLFDRAGELEYWGWCTLSVVAVAVVVARLIFAAIAFTGASAWAMAALTGVLVALVWSSIARYRAADDPDSASAPDSAGGLWLAIFPRRRGVAIVSLAVMPVVAYVLVAKLSGFDWNFMLQKISALAIWAVVFGLTFAATGRRDVPRSPIPLWAGAALVLYLAAGVAVERMPQWLGRPELAPEFILDNYAAANASYRVVRDALVSDPAEDGAFYQFLRANSTVRSTAVRPAEVDFVEPVTPAAERPPHIFLFIVDSLRPDYTAPYNEAVGFTPALAAFARDSFVFRRGFSRYGGTGLSVPAIWAGSLVLHKEYVTPFGPTNALGKLLAANRYERWVTSDHITDDLFSPSEWDVTLDKGVPEMQHTFCGTAAEIEKRLETRRPGDRPVFAMTRPLDLHLANLRATPANDGESYPGFYGMAASRIRRIDRCFGDFVDTLKRRGLYDDSIVVLMSDHGDSLGDLLRWGHAYTLYPEVLRIPLIVHLPERLRSRVTTDLGRVSFSTDLTPTLYALLGYQPADLGTRYGMPLFGPAGEAPRRRGRDLYLETSSYGAVYGVVSQNGRRLYIADAINEREYAYRMNGETLGERVGVVPAERDRDRRFIHDQLTAIAAAYGFRPGP